VPPAGNLGGPRRQPERVFERELSRPHHTSIRATPLVAATGVIAAHLINLPLSPT